MQTDKELENLQRIAEQQRQKRAKIEGRIESLLDDLKEEGFRSVDEAQKALAVLDKEIASKESIFKRKLDEFKLKYADDLAEYS